MTLVVKFACEGQFRRVRVESLTWEQIVTAFTAGFPELKQDTCAFKYRDDEGDLCLLSTATFPDFAELFCESASVRLEVVRTTPAVDGADEPQSKPGEHGCWPGCLGDLLADCFLPRLQEALEHVPREHAMIEGLAHWQPQLVRRAVQALYAALEPFPQMKEAREDLWRLAEAEQLTGITSSLEVLLQSLARLPSEEQRNVASAALGHVADVLLGLRAENPAHNFLASLLGMHGKGQGKGFAKGWHAVVQERIARRKAAQEARMKTLADEKAIQAKAIQERIAERKAAKEARLKALSLAHDKAKERSSADEASQDSAQCILLQQLTDFQNELAEVDKNVKKLIAFHDAAEAAKVAAEEAEVAARARRVALRKQHMDLMRARAEQAGRAEEANEETQDAAVEKSDMNKAAQRTTWKAWAEARRESQEASRAEEVNEETQAASVEKSEMNQGAAVASTDLWQLLEAAMDGP